MPLRNDGRVQVLDACSIQVSGKQIDWDKVYEDGWRGVYWKASQYSSTWDHTFSKQIDLARKAGLAVGAYHFCSQNSDPVKQMKFFHTASDGVGMADGELPPMIDWEFCSTHPGIPEKNCVEWLRDAAAAVTELWYPDNAKRILAGRLERRPVIYTYPDYSKNRHPSLKLPEFDGLGAYPLCWAAYASKKGSDGAWKLIPWDPSDNAEPSALGAIYSVPSPWNTWTLWQYSGNNGKPVPGVYCDIDRQLFNGDFDQFKVFLGYDEIGKVEQC